MSGKRSCARSRSCGVTDDTDRLRYSRPGLALRRAAVEYRRLLPAFIKRLLRRGGCRVRPLAGQIEKGAQHARIRCPALAQGAEEGVQDMRRLPEKGARLLRGLRRDELEDHRQIVRQLARREVQPRFLVRSREIDESRSALARIAVHVLEEVERGRTAAVEERHVGGFGRK